VRLAAGASVTARSTGERLRLKRDVVARLDTLPDGRLIATVGESGRDAAGRVAPPTFTVSLVVSRVDLTPMDASVVPIEAADGSQVRPAAGAPGEGSGSQWIAAGTPVSGPDGTSIGVTAFRQAEPVAHPARAGDGDRPLSAGVATSSPAQARRCGALAADWAERADGAPWVVCWSAPRAERADP